MQPVSESLACADPMTGRGGNMMTRRSTGKTRVARALWYARKGVAELRTARWPRPRRARRACARCSAASAAAPSGWCSRAASARASGSACAAQCRRARSRSRSNTAIARLALSRTGRRSSWAGTVFCLHPHQDFFNVPVDGPGADAGRRAAAPGHPGRQHGDRPQRPLGQRRRPRRPHRRGGRRRRGAAWSHPWPRGCRAPR